MGENSELNNQAGATRSTVPFSSSPADSPLWVLGKFVQAAWTSLKTNLDSRAFWLLCVANAAVSLRDPEEWEVGWVILATRTLRVPLVYMFLSMISDLIGLSDTEEVEASFDSSPIPRAVSSSTGPRPAPEYRREHHSLPDVPSTSVKVGNSAEMPVDQAKRLRALLRSTSNHSGSGTTRTASMASAKRMTTTADLYFMEQLAKLDIRYPDSPSVAGGDKPSPVGLHGSQMLSKASTQGSGKVGAAGTASPTPGIARVEKARDSFARIMSVPAPPTSHDDEGAASSAETSELRLHPRQAVPEHGDEVLPEDVSDGHERRTESVEGPPPAARPRPAPHPFKSFRRKSFCGSMGNMMGLLFTDAAHIVMEKKEKAAHRKEK